jgi:hypothetical protein
MLSFLKLSIIRDLVATKTTRKSATKNTIYMQCLQIKLLRHHGRFFKIKQKNIGG